MGRGSEFHGGAYGNFQPEPVDIDLSDKVTEHPFYEQAHTNQYFEPTEPKHETCQYPGCGRRVHEHRSMYLPPTREAMEMISRAVGEAKAQKRGAKEKEARESHENDEMMKGPYGTGAHVVRARGWSDTGPSTKKQLKQHLIDDHDLDPDDLKYMPNLARDHARWHRQGDDDLHTHGA